MRALAWLGRQGPRAMGVIVLIGVAVPPLGRVLRPYLAEAVFLLLVLAFLRVDTARLRGHLRRPGLILAATAWTALAVPLLFLGAASVAGVRQAAPGLFLGLMLQGLASPMMAAPSLAALMGLDATLVLVTLVTGTVMVPLVAAGFAQLFLGDALAIPPVALGAKLAFMLAGSFLVAAALRRLLGAAALSRQGDAINGINTLLLLVFVSAVLGDVASIAWADPWTCAGLLALGFAVFAGLLAGTAFVFRGAGRVPSLSLAVMASQRNMGLMFAATAGQLPATAWTYFALCQFPIYLSPLLLPPVLRRLGLDAAQNQ
ncbi:Na+-dependent transporter [Roseococcus sp. SYP-B2431]|uniref:Na+-dependent transporter n=1 Tax=Roseococcus sp. SYP-B2431 TaxID=2496640 RepID=UPI00103DE672|nr:Na+-dependent transporter [Roseococcus sp. SYP-B2431]TCH96213.1 Na+-dependent transporter [Roseococcus sp. SYP-B2431]